MFGKKEKNDTPIAIDETNGVSNGGSTSFFGVKGAQIVGGSDYHNGNTSDGVLGYTGNTDPLKHEQIQNDENSQNNNAEPNLNIFGSFGDQQNPPVFNQGSKFTTFGENVVGGGTSNGNTFVNSPENPDTIQVESRFNDQSNPFSTPEPAGRNTDSLNINGVSQSPDVNNASSSVNGVSQSPNVSNTSEKYKKIRKIAALSAAAIIAGVIGFQVTNKPSKPKQQNPEDVLMASQEATASDVVPELPTIASDVMSASDPTEMLLTASAPKLETASSSASSVSVDSQTASQAVKAEQNITASSPVLTSTDKADLAINKAASEANKSVENAKIQSPEDVLAQQNSNDNQEQSKIVADNKTINGTSTNTSDSQSQKNNEKATNGYDKTVENQDSQSSYESEIRAKREEAKRLLAEADSLTRERDALEQELWGKSEAEQIAILKRKVNQQNRIKSENTKHGNRVKHSSTSNKQATIKNAQQKYTTNKSNVRTKGLPYNVYASATGVIVLNQGKGKPALSYVVGDTLPNGAKIKNIHYFDKQIVTNKGIYSW